MKNIKFNVDRPEISSSEISGKQNFEEVLAGHRFMKKPFYKNSWFLGTAGLASLGLIVGGALSFKFEPDEQFENEDLAFVSTEAPPDETNVIPIANYLSKVFEIDIDEANQLTKEEPKIYEEIITLEEKDIEEELSQEQTAEIILDDEIEKPKIFSRMDLNPRISGKINGNITKNELFDENGLVTAADVEIVSFELHIIDGSGGHVLAQEGHELSVDMKESIKNLASGQTIYFEKIKGISKNGVEVSLNPLRYTVY